MAILQFDAGIAQGVVKDVREALKAVAQRHGLVVRMDRASFSTGVLSLNINLSVVSSGGQVVTPEMEEFRLRAATLALDAEDLGKAFRCGTDEFVVHGMVLRARKNHILIRRQPDGAVFRVSADHVRAHLHSDTCSDGTGAHHGESRGADEETV